MSFLLDHTSLEHPTSFLIRSFWGVPVLLECMSSGSSKSCSMKAGSMHEVSQLNGQLRLFFSDGVPEANRYLGCFGGLREASTMVSTFWHKYLSILIYKHQELLRCVKGRGRGALEPKPCRLLEWFAGILARHSSFSCLPPQFFAVCVATLMQVRARLTHSEHGAVIPHP